MSRWAKRGDHAPGRVLPLDHRPALLPRELGDVVRSAATLAARAAPLPSAERLRAGPGPGGRAGALVGVAHPGLDLVEEAGQLGRVPGEDPGRKAVVGRVGLG